MTRYVFVDESRDAVNERLQGIHCPLDGPVPADWMVLSDDHWFWQPLPAGKTIRINAGQLTLVDAAGSTLEDLRAGALATIDQFHADTVQQLVGSPTQVEKDSWSLKLEIAHAITSKTPISPAGQAFLAGAGLTTATAQSAWATSVLGKSAAYAQIVGLAEKLRDTARTAVKAASDATALKAALDAQRTAADAAIANLAKAA